MLEVAGCAEVDIFRRRVHDGELCAIRTVDPPGYLYHLSVSHTPAGQRRALRYPSWDELAAARYDLLPDDIDVVMHLPPPTEFVSVEDTTFHLREYRDLPDDAGRWRRACLSVANKSLADLAIAGRRPRSTLAAMLEAGRLERVDDARSSSWCVPRLERSRGAEADPADLLRRMVGRGACCLAAARAAGQRWHR